jgi:1A family penicillin-binding protein
MWTHSADEGDGASALRHPQRRRIVYAVAVAMITAFILTSSVLAWALHDVPFPAPAEVTSRRVIVMRSADGHLLLHKGSFQLPPVAVENMPADVVNAVISIEDRRFYQHGAIDPWAVLRALQQNLEADKIASGGSTITQQLVKTLLLSPQRTYKRKMQEAAIALSLEQHLTKNEILTSYLNNVYLGSGAIGFPAAAKLYFGKEVADLSLPEAAVLAGMISAPGPNDPLRNLDAARRRAATVLDAMVANGKLSPAAALAAKLHPATPNPTDISPPSTGWFADWVYAKAAAATPPLAGTVLLGTTLDLHLQELAASILKSTLAAYGPEKHVTQAALVAMRPDGAVVAMVGGRSYAESQFNRAVQATRQPGSAFKLFDYYAALREGFSPGDEILDAPVDVNGWEPENSGRHYHGRITLAEAFADSLNTATVRLSQEIGIDRVIAAARDLGLRAPLGKQPSLALGTSEVSLLDLTSAYTAVRAGKAPVEPWGIDSLRLANSQNQLAVGRPDEAQHSLGPYQGQLIDLLKGVVQRGTGRTAALQGFAAGKTGTSQDYRDAWFIGFNDTLTVGVWVGNDDHSPMKGVVGGSIPALIWKRFMDGLGASTTTVAEGPQAPSGSLAQSSDPPPAGASNGQCDIAVCQRYYRSFRESDCSYQPFAGGPRRYCER